MHLFIVNLLHKQMAIKWYQLSSITNQATTKLSSLYERGTMFEGSNVYISSFDYKSFIIDLNIVSFEDSENKFQIFCHNIKFSWNNNDILNELNVHMGFLLPSNKNKGHEEKCHF